MIVKSVTKSVAGHVTWWLDQYTGATKGDEMADQVGVTISQADQTREVPVIHTDGLTAEYSTGCTPTGEWFALGTITRQGTARTMPAWVVVGTGDSAEAAVSNLTLQVQAQAQTALV